MRANTILALFASVRGTRRFNMKTTLYLDYDTHDIVNSFKSSVWLMRHVFKNKRSYLPVLSVERCEKTRKGYHIVLRYEDVEPSDFRLHNRKLSVLFLQSFFESDRCRGLMDYLRIKGGETHYNLLFDYKGERKVNTDDNTLFILNEIIKRAGMR